MRATISWWDLTGSHQSIDTLRATLRDEDVQEWARVPGLRLKFWISDPEANRWGAVMLWDDMADPSAPLPANRASELIGCPPTLRLMTDVEALVEGLPMDGATR